MKLLLFLILTAFIFTNSSFAAEKVEVTTRIGPASATGQFLLETVYELNATQSKYEYKVSFIPGVGGSENRIAAIAEEGRKGIFYGAQSVFTMNKILNPEGQKQIKDITREFIFVGSMSMGTIALMADPKKGYKNVNELVAALKKKDKIFFGTTVGASAPNIMNQLFLEHYKLDDKAQTIYYPRPGDLLRGVLGGEIDYNVFNPFTMNGNLQILMTGNEQRGTVYPDAPTGKELGFPKFRYSAITLFAVHKSNIEFAAEFMKHIQPLCKNEKIKESVRIRGYEPVCLTPTQINKLIDDEIKMLESIDIKKFMTRGEE
jgi:tripartite-type tricarboxylate transporter receptor subunit TctC